MDTENVALVGDVVPIDHNSNSLRLIIPDDIADTAATAPAPRLPIYYYHELTIRDTGTDDAQQIYKPIRGFIEVLFGE